MKEKILIEQINDTLFQLDLGYGGIAGHTAGYIMKDRDVALIETGTNAAVPLYLEALKKLDIEKDQVRYVIVTHVHLDHAGGAGQLLTELPAATLVLHPSGAKHLVDPEKLIASARGVYGEQYDALFGTIIPVPAQRVTPFQEGMTLSLGKRTLALYYSPGHAFHHLVIHSPVDAGVFSGDAAGLFLHIFREFGLEYLILTTTPTQFEPKLMKETLSLIESLQPQSIFYTHFGPSNQPKTLIKRACDLVDLYLEMGREASEKENALEYLTWKMRDFHYNELTSAGVPGEHPFRKRLEMDFGLNAAGILHHLRKNVAA